MAFIRLIVASILIEKGTPIAQLIPFRRAHAALDDVVLAETEADRDAKDRILRSTMAGDGWCRKEREPRAEAVPEGPSGGVADRPAQRRRRSSRVLRRLRTVRRQLPRRSKTGFVAYS
jgi:hypothetical protein